MHRQSPVSTIYRTLIFAVALFFTCAIPARAQHDSAYMALYHHYYQLFDTDSAEAFYEASAQLQQEYMKKGNMLSYYKIWQNEIFYDVTHGKSYQAIKKANDLLEDMKDNETKYYELPYMSLGYIFEQRGSYRMAMHYYQEALNNINPTDSTGLAHIYSELASINFTRNSDEAWQWINRLGGIISSDSLYYRLYLTLKGQSYFFGGEKEEFLKTKGEFDNYLKRTSSLDHNGEHILKIMDKAFSGKYNEALRLLERKDLDYDDIRRCDIRIRIFEMMGRADLAVKETNRRRDLRDSLGSDLLFNNLNEINATIGIAKLDEESTKDREFWLNSVIVLLFIAIGLTISRYISHRLYQKEIEERNEQLEIALDEAKESGRMKDIFIKHISHEIRTPLNIITGYAQVIANPLFELEEEERNRMVQAIGQNTVAITDIVNDLLEVAQEASKMRYRKNDRIAVNGFCRQLMKETEEKNNGRLELCFQSKLSDGFTIQSNQSGIERILQQLLNNALKFTENGQIELSVYKKSNTNAVVFAVTDTGIGIPEAQREQVFKRFYKLDSFTQGLGIGLSMSRKIAVLLGGTLDIDVDYHHGTRMVFTIPVK